VIAFEGDGKLMEYVGGYEDWLRVKRFNAPTEAEKTVAAPVKSEPAPSSKPKVVKLSYKEARELEALPQQIEALEQEQSEIAAHFADGSIFRTDPKRARQLQARSEALEVEVMEALERWETLEQRAKQLS